MSTQLFVPDLTAPPPKFNGCVIYYFVIISKEKFRTLFFSPILKRTPIFNGGQYRWGIIDLLFP